ncbi:F0F1 ATP synthase subunit I [Maritimibacter sp. 55A14]|uniref:AtpZ/AtpI family protein n=1 Tax=Maritimibacter sp. 55A14 TaxID=2174844 RepID=UPI000D621F92|nr:AtpZ/AtpI family protein [Maritimibacter sp. 55A14]PWE32233.1 F0F1 ATP synthase subunit I [Maritimibacter sp. 55A14]
MSDGQDPRKLDALQERIDKLRGTKPVRPQIDDHYSQTHAGWRMITELVTGIVMGVGIGWGLDSLFGTKPVFLVLMTLLGFAAGVRVMLGTAREMQRKYESDAAAARDAGDNGPGGGQDKGNGRGD